VTLADFIARFRLDRDDTVGPDYLWSTAEIRTYLNAAIDEVCERALLIEDRTTAACCQVTLVAAQGDYPLHASIIKVKRVTYGGQAIYETSVEALDGSDSFWENRTGAPTCFVMTGKNSMRLVPTPTVDTVAIVPTIALTVYRTQLALLDEDSDDELEVEVPRLYHERMLAWLYRCALLKRDTETLDERESERQEANFTRAFGERLDANVARKQRDRRPPVTRMIF
jgi:hypothetical protein